MTDVRPQIDQQIWRHWYRVGQQVGHLAWQQVRQQVLQRVEPQVRQQPDTQVWKP